MHNAKEGLPYLQARLDAAEGDLDTSDQICSLERKRADEAQAEVDALRDGLRAEEQNATSLRRQLQDAHARARAIEVSPLSPLTHTRLVQFISRNKYMVQSSLGCNFT